jgi:hypothetical protein
MDMDPVGTNRWVVIPMARHRDRYELPLFMFRVARDVIEDPTWFPLGLAAVREEILKRLSTNQDYVPDPDFMSLQFLADLRSSLHHPVDARRPWSYPRGIDESSSDQGSSSNDSWPCLEVGRKDENETAQETQEQQDSPDQEEDDSVSNASMTSFHSAQEHTGSDESRCEEENNETASAHSSNSPQATGKLPLDSPGSSDSEVSNRHFKLLKANYEFSKLQIKLLKLQSVSRKFQKVKEKAQKKLRRTAQPEKAGCQTDEAASAKLQASKSQAHQNQNPEPSNTEDPAHVELGSLFGSEEE